MINKTDFYPKTKMKKYLKKKNISYRRLALLTGICYQAISHKLNGHRDITLNEIFRISKALKLEPVEVFNLLLEG